MIKAKKCEGYISLRRRWKKRRSRGESRRGNEGKIEAEG